MAARRTKRRSPGEGGAYPYQTKAGERWRVKGLVRLPDGSPREVTGNPAVIEAYLGKRAAKAAAGHTPIELMGGPAT